MSSFQHFCEKPSRIEASHCNNRERKYVNAPSASSSNVPRDQEGKDQISTPNTSCAEDEILKFEGYVLDLHTRIRELRNSHRSLMERMRDATNSLSWDPMVEVTMSDVEQQMRYIEEGFNNIIKENYHSGRLF